MVNREERDLQQSFERIRKEYRQKVLDEQSLPNDPFDLFTQWYQRACSLPISEPNAMALATVSKEATPQVRFVLLKDFSEAGFVFYTNSESFKGKALAANPQAAVVFYWKELEQQVRVEGGVYEVASDIADTYFASRPRGAQLGAIASQQSRALADRSLLETEILRLEAEYSDKEIPRPEYWRGYCLKPLRFEFWQGRENRLHDRFEYSCADSKTWSRRRLYP